MPLPTMWRRMTEYPAPPDDLKTIALSVAAAQRLLVGDAGVPLQVGGKTSVGGSAA
jgi:hypothetical protein